MTQGDLGDPVYQSVLNYELFFHVAGNSLVVYVVVGLGSGMLIVTSLGLMIMALSCLHHKQKMVSTLESQVMKK